MASATPIVTPSNYDFQTTSTSNSSFWIEHVGNTSPQSDEVSPRYAHRTLYAYVSNDRVAMYNFENNVLGYHYVDSSLTLRRVPPQAHPKHPSCYAIKVSQIQGVKFDGKQEELPPAAQLNAGLKDAAKYKRNLVAVEFAPPKYPVYTDDDPKILGFDDERFEYLRYLEHDQQTNVYDVVIPTGRFKFAEGTSGNPLGKVFPGEVTFYEVKTTYSLKWRLVPEDFIIDYVNYDFGYPTKINAAAGHVNATKFCGFPAGTLLLLEPEIERYVAGALRRSDGKPMFYADVVLPIVHFDPPLGVSAGSEIQKGHNNKPWWKSGDTTLHYYMVSSDGTSTGIRVYGSYEFADIFTHWSL